MPKDHYDMAGGSLASLNSVLISIPLFFTNVKESGYEIHGRLSDRQRG
ncbi:MAG: hypothetical protein AB1847_02200 [bacterium]